MNRQPFAQRHIGPAFVFLLSLALLLPATARAAMLTVTSTADSGAGSLRDAVANAASGDVITFSLTGCPCTITLTTGRLFINKDLYIVGPGAGQLTISGGNTTRVFFVAGGTLLLKNLTIAGGLAQGGYGASGGQNVIWISSGGGGAGMGGALFINSGTVIADGVTFSGNRARGGNGGNGNSGNGTGAGGGQLDAQTNGNPGYCCGLNGGGGGDFGGAGGAGGVIFGCGCGTGCGSGRSGGTGGDGAGGGGAAANASSCSTQSGGAGGFGGGGGGGANSSQSDSGGFGGFGGGGGGSRCFSTNAGQWGGNGGCHGINTYDAAGGGGGAGLGGAIFNRGGTLSLAGATQFSNDAANRGTGGASSGVTSNPGGNGKGKGGALYLYGGAAKSTSAPVYSANTADDQGGTATDSNDIYGSITACPAMSATLSTGVAACTGLQGSVRVTVTGGTGPYRVVLSNGSTFTGASPVDVPAPAGSYTGLTVLDSTGCAVSPTGSATIASTTCSDLSITKTANPNPVLVGQPVTYTITVTNNGPDPATGVTMNDNLPPQLTPPSQLSFVDDDGTAGEFGGGTQAETLWDATANRERTADAAVWSLPDGATSSGWTDMTGNTLLYHFNEAAGPTFANSAGAGGTGTGAGTYVAGSRGKLTSCVDLDGASGLVTASPTVPVGNSPYTIMAWIKPDQMGVRGIVGWGPWGSGNQVNAFRLTANGLVNYWWGNDLTVVTNDLTGAWHHVVATFDGTTRRILLDGAVVGSDTPSGHNVPSNTNFAVGRTNNIEYFDGLMDEVAIFNRGLTVAQIQQIFHRQAPRAGRNAWDLPGGATSTGWTDMTGNVLLLHLNEASGAVADSSGANNNAAYTGGFYNEPGRLGTAFGFDGASQKVTVPASSSMNVAGPMTLMAWFRPDGSSVQPILEFNSGAATGVHVWQFDAASKIFVNFIDTSTVGHQIMGPVGQLVAGEWYHVAAVYDGNLGTLYLDGVVVASATLGAFTPQTSYPLLIGSRTQSSNWFRGTVDEVALFNRPLSAAQVAQIYRRQAPNFSGRFDSVIKDAGAADSWNGFSWLPDSPEGKPLPNGGATESGYPSGNANMAGNLLLMHLDETSGTLADRSAAGATGTPFGGVTLGAEGKIGNSAQFDGVTSGIDVPSNPAFELTSGTVEAWIRPTWGVGVPTYQPAFLALRTGSTARFSLHLQNNYGLLYFFTGASAVFPVTMHPFEWHHVAFTFGGGTITAYVDGAPAGSPVSMSVGTLTGSPFRIGYSGDPANSNERFTGNIDEVGYYSRVLSAGEIADHFRRGARRAKFQLRSCDDVACAGENFAGPDGTAATYFSEFASAALVPAAPVASFQPNNRWFQYRALLEDDSPYDAAPVASVTISHGLNVTASQGGCALASQALACSLGNLANGASATITVPCTANAAGNVVNTASISSSVYDPVAANNSGSAPDLFLDPAADYDNDGVNNATDCRPLDNTTWAAPTPARNLLLAGPSTTTLNWTIPAGGGTAFTYDVLRSATPADFSAPVCVAKDVSVLTAQDSAAVPAAFYYLVRAKNACGTNMGTDSGGTPHTGGVCP